MFVCVWVWSVIVLVKGILGRHDSRWAEHMCEIYVNGPVMQTSCVGGGGGGAQSNHSSEQRLIK